MVSSTAKKEVILAELDFPSTIHTRQADPTKITTLTVRASFWTGREKEDDGKGRREGYEARVGLRLTSSPLSSRAPPNRALTPTTINSAQPTLRHAEERATTGVNHEIKSTSYRN